MTSRITVDLVMFENDWHEGDCLPLLNYKVS